MQSQIIATVNGISQAQANLDATARAAASVISQTFQDRSGLEVLKAEIEAAKQRAQAMQAEAASLLAGALDFFGGFGAEVSFDSASLLEAPSAAQDAVEAQGGATPLLMAPSAPEVTQGAEEEVVAVAANSPTAEAQEATPLVPALEDVSYPSPATTTVAYATYLESLDRKGLQAEAKGRGISAGGSNDSIIQRLLDAGPVG